MAYAISIWFDEETEGKIRLIWKDLHEKNITSVILDLNKNLELPIPLTATRIEIIDTPAEIELATCHFKMC